ncbi:MAG: threonine synthase [Clostridia bacterium]|nr:threonine synthase [Clostridia bacterium]
MKYTSTRNTSITAAPSMAVLNGIASDGGLFIFDEYPLAPSLNELCGMTTFELYTEILSSLIFDIPKEKMADLVSAAYTDKFETGDLTPLVKVGDDYVLELFRGPTSAFKDVALSILPHLVTTCARMNGVEDDIHILTATSGDTGKAAMAGFADVEGTRITVFFPKDGVSTVQQAQMLTQEGKNVTVCSVKGNFDDAQTGVKEIFSKVQQDKLLAGKGVRLSSANSINIGRLAPQVVYYYKSYFDLVRAGTITMGDKIDFVVPTGNFGDILAGYIAKGMGLPVGTLVCASNKNDVLTEFIETGRYNRNRTFYKTASPSMDILVSSNLERLLYLMSGNDADKIAGYMSDLKTKGEYTVDNELKTAIANEFYACAACDETAFVTIKSVYEEKGYLLDTHTAVAMHACSEYKKNNPGHNLCVVLSTASPYKFAADVLFAITGKKESDGFKAMRDLETLTNVPIPKNLSGLDTKPTLHSDSIEKEAMLDYVIDFSEKKI